MAKDITEQYLKQLDDAAKAATKGPWKSLKEGAMVFTEDMDTHVCDIRGWGGFEKALGEKGAIKQQDANCDYIALTDPDNILALTAEVRRLREVVIEAFEADGEDDTMCVLENEVIDIKKGDTK